MISIKRVLMPRKKRIRIGRVRLVPKAKPVSRLGQIRVEPPLGKPPEGKSD